MKKCADLASEKLVQYCYIYFVLYDKAGEA